MFMDFFESVQVCVCVCVSWVGAICDYLGKKKKREVRLRKRDSEREAASLCGVVLVMVLEHSD